MFNAMLANLFSALDVVLDQDIGCQITVLSPRLSRPPPHWRNIAFREVGFLQGHAWEQIELPWYARGRMLFCPGNTAPAISLFAAAKLIVTIHDLSYKYFPNAYRATFRLWYRFLIPLILRRADIVITVSESERRAIVTHYPCVAPRLHAIANGGLPLETTIDMTNIAPESGGYILYVGSLSKRKNVSRLVAVACRLAEERGFRFVFAGDTAKTLAKSVRSTSRNIYRRLIAFAGPVEDAATLASLYRQAACFLFPSLYKSSGLPPIEAMAYGCPVIASDIPALRERCGDAAIYCDPYDIKSIVAATIRVMDDAALRLHMRTLGYRQAATFSWTLSAQQTLELIYGTCPAGISQHRRELSRPRVLRVFDHVNH